MGTRLLQQDLRSPFRQIWGLFAELHNLLMDVVVKVGELHISA